MEQETITDKVPANFELRPEDRRLNLDVLAEAASVLAGLAAKLETARDRAFAQGSDFAFGPIETAGRDFAGEDGETEALVLSVKGGPVDAASFEAPLGWTVLLNPGPPEKEA